MPPRTHLRRRNQRGNALIEIGLTFTATMAILCAVLDLGLFIFLQCTFQHAVREGVRYAVTSQVQVATYKADGVTPATYYGQTDSIRNVVKVNSFGFLSKCPSADNPCTIDVNFYNPSDLSTQVTDNSPNNVVEVKVSNYKYKWMAPVWRWAGFMMINAAAADRMEGLAGGAVSPSL
jgi:Flp pilus assembly protein TadG